MATLTEINNFLNGINDKALSWYQTISGRVVVPGQPSGIGTSYSYRPSELQPSGASQTPSGGVPRTNAFQVAAITGAGVVVVMLSFFVAKRAKIL